MFDFKMASSKQGTEYFGPLNSLLIFHDTLVISAKRAIIRAVPILKDL